MAGGKNKEHIILHKLLYTLVILAVYFLGKNLPLHGIDFSVYIEKSVSTEELLQQMIAGDIYQYSLFALGISPYMLSSILVQMISFLRSSEIRTRISPVKTNRQMLFLTVVFAIVLAFAQVQELSFAVSDPKQLLAVKLVAVIEMVTGAVMILWLSVRNRKYGIGGQSVLVMINVLDGMVTTFKSHEAAELLIPVLLSFMAMAVMVIMENSEKRIPVQRISIHNIYADKNYLAIKMNPVGVMPAMFSMAFFMLPQKIVSLLLLIFENREELLWLRNNLNLEKPLGIVVYLCILYLLTLFSSRVFLNPEELTEQFLKSGDSIRNVHAGKETRKYLSKTVTGLAFFSATMMGSCLGFPMLLQLMGTIEGTFAALPTSAMVLTGIVCNLGREFMAIKNLEAYQSFL